jgi:hypothetical protein
VASGNNNIVVTSTTKLEAIAIAFEGRETPSEGDFLSA